MVLLSNMFLVFKRRLAVIAGNRFTCTVACSSDFSAVAGELVDICLVESPCRNLVLEKNIKFSVRSILTFGQHEEHEDTKDDSQTGEKKSCLARPIPVCR